MTSQVVPPPLNRGSVQKAHELIHPYIHRTPVLVSQTLNAIATNPRNSYGAEGGVGNATKPNIRLFFKCENYQRVGAFKCRGAFHALARLRDEELSRGVVTHSSGNHAQALALAARTRGIKAYIVMPTISTPSKIAATKGYGAEVIFSGSTSQEREAMVAQVVERTGAILVPPYDHPNIILGQGTMALELEEQVEDMLTTDPKLDVHYQGVSEDGGERLARDQANNESSKTAGRRRLDAVITPCGGGGMLSGVATAMEGTGVRVYGAEPAFEGADDARRGLANGERITTVKTLTIADGLRTPVGKIPWSIISDPTKVQGIFAVTEEQIKNAMKLVLERMKIFVEPSAVVGLATILYNDDFRTLLAREAGPEGWNIGVVLSGGNTTVEAIAKLFGETHERAEREAGIVGQDGTKLAENVAG